MADARFCSQCGKPVADDVAGASVPAVPKPAPRRGNRVLGGISIAFWALFAAFAIAVQAYGTLRAQGGAEPQGASVLNAAGLRYQSKMYEDSVFVKKNFQKAKGYFQRAAAKEYTPAVCNLGICYLQANELTLAEQIFRSIAGSEPTVPVDAADYDAGDATANYYLGKICEEKKAVQDFKMAYLWYRKAARGGG